MDGMGYIPFELGHMTYGSSPVIFFQFGSMAVDGLKSSQNQSGVDSQDGPLRLLYIELWGPYK